MIISNTTSDLLACTFCGHHDASDEIKPALYIAIKTLITDYGVTTFHVGNHGHFDNMVSDMLRSMKEQYPKISAYMVLAYMPGEKREGDLDEKLDTLYPDGLETVPKRFAITHRNRWMIDNSDYIISGVKHSWGGAADTLQYATRKKLNIITI